MAEDIQALAAELAKLNKNSTLWAQPQIQASGAASMMTQNQAQLQPYLQDYAYANPGSMNPAMYHADPRQANYALQQQHFLNPYRAQAYGGAFNSNMPGAEFATSSRLGIYRPGQTGTTPSGYAQPGFMGDTATLTGFRSYAGYQNPYEEQIAASRRMTQRAETATAIGIEGAGLAASFAFGGPIGIAASIGGTEAMRYTTGQYFARREETGQIHDVMKDLISGTSASGLTGTGASMRQSSKMMRELRMASAYNPNKSIEDYHDVLQTGAATGLFNFEDDTGEITGKVKKATKMVNMMMMLAGDPDIQSTIKRMSDFQAMGVSIGQMDRMASDMKSFSNLANASFEDVMSRGGAMGAQQMQMMGGSAAFGMRAGGMAQGMANRMLQSGVLTPEEAALRGGKSGIMQTMSGMMTNDIHSYLSSRAPGIMTSDGKLDKDAFNKMISGTGGDQISNALTRFRGMDRNEFLLNSEDVVAQAESMMTPVQMIQMQRQIMKETMGATGMSKEDYFASKGKAGKSLRHMLSDNNLADQVVSESRVMQEKSSKRYAEELQANRWYNKAARQIGIWKDEVFDSEIFDDLAENSDRRASAASGGVYRRNLASTAWMTEANKKRFIQSKEKEVEEGLDFRRYDADSLFGGRLNPLMAKMRKVSVGGDKLFEKGFGVLDAALKSNKGRKAYGSTDLSTAEIKSKLSKLDNLMEDGQLSMSAVAGYEGDDLGDLLQIGKQYGNSEHRTAIQTAVKARQQSQENYTSLQLDKYKGEHSAVIDALGGGSKGKKLAQQFSNLKGAGITPRMIKALVGGDKGGIDKINEILAGQSEGDRELLGSALDSIKMAPGMEGLLDDVNFKGNLVGSDRYNKAHARAGSKANKLARDFMFNGDFDVFSNSEDILKQEDLQEEMKKLKIDEDDVRKGLQKDKVNAFGEDPNKAVVSSAMTLERIETILKSVAQKESKGWFS